MDWPALRLSLTLAALTCAILVPFAVLAGRALAWRRFRGKGMVHALIAVPLILPPTVLGFFLLVATGPTSWVGQVYEWVAGRPLAFSFDGLVLASIIFNLPFAIQPIEQAFHNISGRVREAAWCSGLSRWRTFWMIELPLAWPGIAAGTALTFAHTMGEFGVVLMIGGNIPGETRTLAISIYDSVQTFDNQAAAAMSALLLAVSLGAIGVVYGSANRRRAPGHDVR